MRAAEESSGSEAGGGTYLEVVDQGRGSLRAGGHLTAQGADLLRGTVLALRGRGHERVTVNLQGVHAADDAGLRVLRTLQESVTAHGGELVLVSPPGPAPEAVAAPRARTVPAARGVPGARGVPPVRGLPAARRGGAA